ncbi:NAD(P)/FAD-dependent oxidoreductase [Actinomadura macrotermitis]|uniref:3-phenylpropionate/cinnamic acid dioxygenase ferredoxin--NAD(+) reductase component n=1 Tax=Actinomadura macrotermitis TaxID=2585200 RepID=A0A7K0BY90_9ACTN|nr:FAD-dependent oxidoreductase [Actinomadura macrotermitis]MQY05594.1 3-phenylpropionate/cinnamic acid dioxygenase ferredoxin--NAD(+) reductase component [Actinomadura macrotermitis]
MTEVIVIGGGYAGVLAANRLTSRDDVTVTLVNPRPSFVERIRLHQLVAGSDDAVVDYKDVLNERVELVVDTATAIDRDARTVSLAGGGTLGYDYLVYAVGSRSGAPEVPGADRFAYPLATLEEAERLRQAVDAAPADAALTVVGGGATGIETAAELAEAGRTVTLVCGGRLGPYLHPNGRRFVAKRLAALGVTVVEGAEAAAVTADAVRLAGGSEVRGHLTIWAAGFGVPDLAARSGLSVDEAGRLLTDETLTSVDDDRIVAAGDAASPSGLPYRMGCQSAVQLGPHAADAVLRRIEGGRPEAVSVGFAGLCVSLGRGAGIFQFARKDDTAIRFYVGGRAGARLKEFVVTHTVKQLADEARKPGARVLKAKDDSRLQRVQAARENQPVHA